MGAILFRERQSQLQLGALGLAAVGVALQAFGQSGPPLGALLLCATWSAYGLVRKQAPVPAAGGLLAETLVLALPAAFMVAYLAGLPKGLAFDDSFSHATLLALSGAATACPLILFAFAARRLSMTTLGLMQYISPSIQFLVGLAYGEPLGPVRLASFVLIWSGLAFFVADALVRERGRSLA
jgi:chloramphenicol-sensitive protein RarD